MNPFQHSNELCFQISPDPYQEHATPQHHLIHLPLPDHHPVTCSPDKSIKSRQRQRQHHRSNDTSPTKKKMIHRDIERQRRQEMAARCASLRSLLPLEYIKGKRSISDHMNEAVNYIKHLQKSTSVLGAKRDELRKLSNLRGELNVPVGHEESSSRVMVRPMADGIEVLLSSRVTRGQDLPLSRVLQIVLQQGLVAVSCCSSKVKERFLHTIQAQVSDPNCNNIDPSQLQEKLTEAAFQSSSRFSSNFSD